MVRYQLLDLQGDVEEERILKLKDGDKLIMEYDSEKISLEVIDKIYHKVKESLESDNALLALPNGVRFKVLSINSN